MKKYLLSFILLIIFLTSGFSSAKTKNVERKDTESILSAFEGYADLRIASITKSLEILASTKELKSGDWEIIKPLLSGYQNSEGGLIVWYMRPDGTYYTVEKNLVKETLKDRKYFPDLISGKKIIGSLVISKSTGQRSAVEAVPVFDGSKVVGAVGVSLFLDKLSDELSLVLKLREGSDFFSLSSDGTTTLHRKKDRHFLDPRELGSETLKKAVNEMLTKDSGEVSYEFDNKKKNVIYRTSSMTHWKFAITLP